MNRVITLIVMDLAMRFGFDAEEGINYLLENEKNKKTKTKKTKTQEKKIPLPWLGIVDSFRCQALCLNYGLYTQCEEAPDESLVSPFCKKCIKHGQSHGIVKERMNPAFKGKGKRPIVTYGKVLQQRGISREDAEAYAERRGIVIPEEHFALKRPRLRKQQDYHDPHMEILEEGLEEELEEEKYQEKKERGVDMNSDSDDDSDYEEISCSLFSHKGEDYLMDICNNNVYGKGEGNPYVGKYDAEKGEIDIHAEE
mgnify:FL=1